MWNFIENIIAAFGAVTITLISIFEFKRNSTCDKELLKEQIIKVYEPLYKILNVYPNKGIQDIINKIEHRLKSPEQTYIIPLSIRENFNKLKRDEIKYEKFKRTVILQYKKARNTLKIYPKEPYNELYFHRFIRIFLIIFAAIHILKSILRNPISVFQRKKLFRI